MRRPPDVTKTNPLSEYVFQTCLGFCVGCKMFQTRVQNASERTRVKDVFKNKTSCLNGALLLLFNANI